jgi:hypothetical protein
MNEHMALEYIHLMQKETAEKKLRNKKGMRYLENKMGHIKKNT